MGTTRENQNTGQKAEPTDVTKAQAFIWHGFSNTSTEVLEISHKHLCTFFLKKKKKRKLKDKMTSLNLQQKPGCKKNLHDDETSLERTET